MKKAILGLYRHDHKKKTSTLEKRIELDLNLYDLLRNKKWKQVVADAVGDIGVEILSIGVVHSQADLDVNIVVSIARKPAAFGDKRKPKTRGGQPIDGPIKTGKTMAAKRRAARETPRR